MAYDADLAARLRDERKRDGNNRRFYKSAAWRALRSKVLRKHRGQCQDCLAKSPAMYTPATCVHHEMHVDTHPGYALSETYKGKDGTEHDNLIPLCHDCHDKRHGRDWGDTHTTESKPITEERW